MPTSCPNAPIDTDAPPPIADWRLDALRELAAIGMDLTRKLAATPTEALPPEKAAAAFAKFSRAIRYTIALHDRLEHPPAATRPGPGPSTAARLRIKQRALHARLVEAIPSGLEPREHESLHAEIDARLDAICADPNFALHSPGILVLQICRDLGLTPSLIDFDRDDLLMAGYFDTLIGPNPFSNGGDPAFPRPPLPD